MRSRPFSFPFGFFLVLRSFLLLLLPLLLLLYLSLSSLVSSLFTSSMTQLYVWPLVEKAILHHLSTTSRYPNPPLFVSIIPACDPFSLPTPFLTSFEGMWTVCEALFSAQGFVRQAITEPADWLPLRSLLTHRGCVTSKALQQPTNHLQPLYICHQCIVGLWVSM